MEPNDVKSGEVVWIGCKLPHGIWLEIIPKPKDPNANTARNPGPTGPRIRLAGANDMSVQLPQTVNSAVHRFAITPVPKPFWDRWVKEHGVDYQWFRDGHVFVANNEPRAKAMAKEREKLATGFEPLAPKGDGKFDDPRMPAGIAVDQDSMNRASAKAVQEITPA